MANSKSAIKRIRTAERNRLRNKAYKSALRTLTKKYFSALETYTAEPNPENMEIVNQAMSAAYSKIDKAVFQTGIEGTGPALLPGDPSVTGEAAVLKVQVEAHLVAFVPAPRSVLEAHTPRREVVEDGEVDGTVGERQDDLAVDTDPHFVALETDDRREAGLAPGHKGLSGQVCTAIHPTHSRGLSGDARAGKEGARCLRALCGYQWLLPPQ